MNIEELKIYDDSNMIDVDNISKSIIELSELPDEISDQLTDALYEIQAIAQNEYNKDYWRVLYNALIRLSDNYDTYLKDYIKYTETNLLDD